MKLPHISRPFRRDREVSRGQALVEFAIVLPILLLLLVLAIDFGRVYFGWVGLQNASRIAANNAAQYPDAWAPPGNAAGQTRYREAVLNDLRGLNCERPGGGAWTTASIPTPIFEDKPATSFSPDPYEIGDHATVAMQCRFGFITPIVGAILGNTINIGAYAEFPVRAGVIDGIPVGVVTPPAGCVDKVVPALVGLTVANARIAWTNAQFTGPLVPTTGFATDVVTSQSPASGLCLPASTTMTVAHVAPGPCGADKQVPNLVGLTVSQARSTWSVNFTGSFTPSSGNDANVVSAQTTSPTSSPGDCRPATTTVTVTNAPPPPPQCTVPQVIGLKANAGQTAFANAGFTGTYSITRPPSGNYTITSQSLIGGQLYVCTSNMTVAGN